MGSVGVLNHEIHGANFLSELGFSEVIHIHSRKFLILIESDGSRKRTCGRKEVPHC